MRRGITAVVGLMLAAGPAMAANDETREVAVNGLRVQFGAVADDVFRCDVSPKAGTPSKAPAAEVAAGGSTLKFEPESGRLILERNGRAAWNGTFSPIRSFGRGKTPGLAVEWKAAPDEFVCGLGERFDSLNQYGKKVDLWIADLPGQGKFNEVTYCVVPVLFSSRGYALFTADNPEGMADLNSDKSGLHRYHRAGQTMTLYLAADDSLKDLLRKRAAVQGGARSIPDWAWGPWISRNSYENQSEAEEAIRGMVKRGMPVAAIVQEAWKGPSETGEFNSFSTSKWPRLQQYFELCREHEIRTILWEVPIVYPKSPHYAEGVKNGCFVKDWNGRVRPRTQWMADFANIDFTNPRAVEYFKNLLRPTVRLGIAGFKADDGEDIQAEDVFSDGRRGWQLHNEYAARWAKALDELLNEEREDGVLWARSGSLHSEKHPALWAGDQYATWPQLRSLVSAGQSAGMSGLAFWGHDIGGYIGDPSPELYIRWLQFGAFSPLMQYHGQKPREPWLFGEQAEKTYKLLANLRMNLRPTLIALGKEAAETGVPIMRPMAVEFPDDRRFDKDDSQYMLGPDILVAPVLQEGARARVVKFPEGRWQHLLVPVAFKGPSALRVPISLDTAPAFVREGASIEVELAEDAALGQWQKGAPVRRLEYGPDRVPATRTP